MKAIRRRTFFSGWLARVGFCEDLPAKQPGRVRFWFQAPSVGELLSIDKILNELIQREDVECVLTVTTSSAYRLACERYQTRGVPVRWFPLDFWPCMVAVWQAIQPDRLCHVDGEIWPEHFHQAQKRGVPITIVNARISDRSWWLFGKVKFWTRTLFRPLRVCACSPQDAHRYEDLGTPGHQVTMTGNLKCDTADQPSLSGEQLEQMRHQLGLDLGKSTSQPLILLGASTWPGEERLLLELFSLALQQGLSVRLILVPRHVERRAELVRLLNESGFAFHLRSWGPAKRAAQVCLLDTLGELDRFTELADVVYIGKSFPPHDQGQSPLRALALGKAVCYGPGMRNFQDLCRGVESVNGALRAPNQEVLQFHLLKLLKSPQQRAQLGGAARDWHFQQKGASARTLTLLLEGVAPRVHGI